MMPPVDETQYVPDGTGTSGAVLAIDRLDRYRILGRLGAGASGTVYRAHDGDRVVAIKVLNTDCDASVRTRFLNEARAIVAVQHPNILAVLETVEGVAPYMVMELASGTLRDAIRARSLDAEAVRKLGVQITHALAAAHAAAILHRDVKPANILCVDGEWKLADFGIARLPDSTLTDTGQFLGSPSYAAPESLRAGQFTPASDVYALAATLYEAIAGAPPHGEHDMPSVVRKLSEEPIPLQLRCPVPRAIADAIMSALSRDPALRPSATELARQLGDEAQERVAIIAVPAPPPSKRIRRIAIASAVFAAVMLAVAIARTRQPTAPRPPVFASPRVDHAPTQAPQAPKPAPQVDPPPDPSDSVVDDDTARQMLRQLEHDARREMDRVHGKRRRSRRDQ